jgi:hypothetical protein
VWLKGVLLPEAQVPVAVPPLLPHSLDVKHVPCTGEDAVDVDAVHKLVKSYDYMLFTY